jgi:hypothetical protein
MYDIVGCPCRQGCVSAYAGGSPVHDTVPLLSPVQLASIDAGLKTTVQKDSGSEGDTIRDWGRLSRRDRLIRVRQAIADQEDDVDAFIALEEDRSGMHQDSMAVAERLLAAGRGEEALEWVRRPARHGLGVMDQEDIADATSGTDLLDCQRVRLEAHSPARRHALGDRTGQLRRSRPLPRYRQGKSACHQRPQPDFPRPGAQDTDRHVTALRALALLEVPLGARLAGLFRFSPVIVRDLLRSPRTQRERARRGDPCGGGRLRRENPERLKALNTRLRQTRGAGQAVPPGEWPPRSGSRGASRKCRLKGPGRGAGSRGPSGTLP